MKNVFSVVLVAIMTNISFILPSFADTSCPDGQISIDGQCVNGKFAIKTTSTNSFAFKISPSGEFTVNCGAGGTLSGGSGISGNTITRSSTSAETYRCTYSTSSIKTIIFSGTATAYASSNVRVLQLAASKVSAIYGSLGAIFPTLNDGSNDSSKQPNFSGVFQSAKNLKSIPEDLFKGIKGRVNYMFSGTFDGCTGLTSIPVDLFKGISGSAQYMFSGTFNGCTGLTSIPVDLFKGISGSAQYMFYNTFSECTALTNVPYNLFDGLSGTADMVVFIDTFRNDTNLRNFVLADGTTTVNYIPAQFFGSMTPHDENGGGMNSVFYNTNIATSCPEDTEQNITGFESRWNGHVSCIPLTSIANANIRITKDTQIADCNYDILETYENSVDLKANWTPNTINLVWYSDNTEVSSGTCLYDGGIELPSTPNKTGYTFGGWRVRSNN